MMKRVLIITLLSITSLICLFAIIGIITNRYILASMYIVLAMLIGIIHYTRLKSKQKIHKK